MRTPPHMSDRILRALRLGPAHGQTELLRTVMGGGSWTCEDQAEFNRSLRILLGISDSLVLIPQVTETKRQTQGTGHEGPPVFEYTYELVKS